MIQTGGLAILFAWLILTALLALLAYFVLRAPADPVSEATRHIDETDHPHSAEASRGSQP
jgi:hypothetical protein